MGTLEERLDQAERSIALMAGLLLDVVHTYGQNTVALHMVLRAKGMLTDEEVDAQFSTLQEFAARELADGHDPRYDRLRQLRKLVQARALGQDTDDEEEDDLP